eukprot:gene53-5_t
MPPGGRGRPIPAWRARAGDEAEPEIPKAAAPAPAARSDNNNWSSGARQASQSSNSNNWGAGNDRSYGNINNNNNNGWDRGQDPGPARPKFVEGIGRGKRVSPATASSRPSPPPQPAQQQQWDRGNAGPSRAAQPANRPEPKVVGVGRGANRPAWKDREPEIPKPTVSPVEKIAEPQVQKRVEPQEVEKSKAEPQSASCAAARRELQPPPPLPPPRADKGDDSPHARRPLVATNALFGAAVKGALGQAKLKASDDLGGRNQNWDREDREVVDLTAESPGRRLAKGERCINLTRKSGRHSWGMTTKPYIFEGADWSHEVVAIDENTPAWNSGMMIGDIILEAKGDVVSGSLRGGMTGPSKELRLRVKDGEPDPQHYDEYRARSLKDRDLAQLPYQTCFICNMEFETVEDWREHLESDEHQMKEDELYEMLMDNFDNEGIAQNTIAVLSGQSSRGKGLIGFAKPESGWGCFLCDRRFGDQKEMVDHFTDPSGIHAANRAMSRWAGIPVWFRLRSCVKGGPRFWFDHVTQEYCTEIDRERWGDIKQIVRDLKQRDEMLLPLTNLPRWVEKLPGSRVLSYCPMAEDGKQCIDVAKH